MTDTASLHHFRDGTTAIVTGAAGGIGRETVRLLTGAGVRVIGIDINQAALDAIDDPLFIGRKANCCDPDTISSLVPRLQKEFGPIAYLVNNAGPPSSAALSIEDGLAQTAGAMQRMTEAWAGGELPLDAAVVNVASLAGVLSGGPPPAMIRDRGGAMPNGWYGAGKAAIAALTRFQAVFSVGRFRSNAVAPGVIATPRMADLTSGPYGKMMIERSPVGRLGAPEDVAHAILFLLGPGAAYINGVTLPVDGGACLVY